MQHNDLSNIFYSALPMPVADEVFPLIPLSQKISYITRSLNPNAHINDINRNDIWELIANNEVELQTLPAYVAAHLTSLYRQSNDFRQLHAQMIDPNIQCSPEAWRIYTYVADVQHLAVLPEEKLAQLGQHALNAALPELQIAHHHITLLRSNHMTEQYFNSLRVIINAIDQMRANGNLSRHNLCGLHLRYNMAGLTLSFIDFTSAWFYSRSTTGVNLSYSNLQDAHVPEYSLTSAILTGTNLCNADLNSSFIQSNGSAIPPDITVLGLRYLARPLNQEDIQNRLTHFYQTFCIDWMYHLGFIRSAIAKELADTILNDDTATNEDKLNMLNTFMEHPLFMNEHPRFSGLFNAASFRLFGTQVFRSEQKSILDNAIQSLRGEQDNRVFQPLAF